MNSVCINADACQEWELEAYLHGEALPHVAEHLEQCPACSTQIEADRVFRAQMVANLYRFDCPSPDTIRDYYWDDLPTTNQLQVKTHLDECIHCATTLNSLRTYMTSIPIDQPITEQKPEDAFMPSLSKIADYIRQASNQVREQVPIAIAQLMSPSNNQLSLVTLRSDEKIIPTLRSETPTAQLFETEDITLNLMLRKTRNGLLMLAVQLLSLDALELIGTYKLHSIETDSEPIEGELDQANSFTISRLYPDIYQLTVKLADKVILIPELRLL